MRETFRKIIAYSFTLLIINSYEAHCSNNTRLVASLQSDGTKRTEFINNVARNVGIATLSRTVSRDHSNTSTRPRDKSYFYTTDSEQIKRIINYGLLNYNNAVVETASESITGKPSITLYVTYAGPVNQVTQNTPGNPPLTSIGKDVIRNQDTLNYIIVIGIENVRNKDDYSKASYLTCYPKD